MFPNGRLEIVVQFDQPHRPVVGGGWDGPFPSACTSGLQVAPFVIEGPPGRMRVLGLRLHPTAAFRLLGVPLGELTGGTFDVGDLLGRAGRALEVRLHCARDGAARVHETLLWVEEQLQRRPPADAAIAWAVNELERDPAVAIGALQRESGLDRTRFGARFRAHTGASPKQFAKIVRLREALEALRCGSVPLGDAAARAGYYDQPHMNADFRELTGLSPGEFRASLGYPPSAHTAE